MKRCLAAMAVWLMMVFQVSAYGAMPEELVAVGKAVGIDVKCSGLLVVGFSEDSPAKESGLHRGDLIIRVDGEPVTEASGLREKIQDKSQVTLTALRRDREQSFLVYLQESDGVEMIGVNVKSEMAGVGTVTYYDPATAVFGALGHGVTDGATGKLFPVREGFICKATILTVDRGQSGAPGMLQGAFDSGTLLGQVTKNTPYGIFGVMHTSPRGQVLPVGSQEEIRTGPAEILCNVEGDKVEPFSVEITRIYPMEDGTGRDMMLHVTDDRLLARTGGIVQGM